MSERRVSRAGAVLNAAAASSAFEQAENFFEAQDIVATEKQPLNTADTCGNLTFIEASRHVRFEIRRVYYHRRNVGKF